MVDWSTGFLAVMNSSRSDVVTLSVCSSVRSFVRLSVRSSVRSFVRSFVRPLVRHEGVFFSRRSYKDVSRSLMGVSKKYQGCFMQVSWIGSFKVVSRKFQESFKGVVREFSGSFKGVSKKF